MNRSPLAYRVECKMPPSASFEPIAAFNVQPAAIAYARSCLASNGRHGLEYRVTYRGKTLPLYETE